MKGTKFGAMVIPRDPESSNLMWLLDWSASPQMRMPHGKKKLSICDRNAIRAWIREGAKNNSSDLSRKTRLYLPASSATSDDVVDEDKHHLGSW